MALAVLACGLVGLLAPAVASAVEYEVNSTADEADEDPGTGGCETAGNACTLRAAIEESNDSAEPDEVTFAPAFDGKTGDTIALTLGEIPIKEPVVVEGNQSGQQCQTSAAVAGPCVEVSGAGLKVESGEPAESGEVVVIRGLAITGAGTAINVINKSTNFIAENDWLGVKLGGAAGANTRGIFLDPESDQATIGGVDPTKRNLIANSTNEGLDIQGASNATVLGNYFGVAPDGTTQAQNSKNIEVTDSGAFKAVGNELGGVVSGEDLTSLACDGACNVISGSNSYGIDLKGDGGEEAPASGPTVIQGNYIGLDGPGGAALGNALDGVRVGKAKEVTIGGPSPGEANHINGGERGVLSGPGADNLTIEGNLIGVTVTGTSVLQPPSVEALSVSSEGVSSLAAATEIRGNQISMLGGIGIVQHSAGGTIAENEVFGGQIGIRTYGLVGAEGNTIEGNVIENAEDFSVLIENDSNTVVGNRIGKNGLAGIHIGPSILLGPASGNLIGGGTPAAENTIAGNGGDAIEIVGEESAQNEVAHNDGKENGGLFIDLAANGPGNPPLGPNLGIQVPTISSATVSGASGDAEAGATVRVFRKATSSGGEIESFLGQPTADGGGKWSLSYGSAVPGGTPIAATQTTSAKGTSELALATTATPPGEGGDGGGGATKVDKTPPQTKITKGPKKKSHKRTAKFKFTSSEQGSTFRCKLDRKPVKPCRSPKKYKKLKPGKHVFKVFAVDRAGNEDPTPAKRKFRVLGAAASSSAVAADS